MVDLSALSVLILVLGALELATVAIAVGWLGRLVRERRERRLAAELRGAVGSLRASGPLRRMSERVLVGGGVLALGAVGWGFLEHHLLHTTEVRVASPKLRPEARIRVAHLSDLHLESDGHLAAEVVSRVAAMQPDLIAFTGDAINDEGGLGPFRATMQRLAQLAPTYTVRGNWETWWFPQLDLYGGTGAVALDGQSRLLTIRGERLWVVGIGVDREAALEAALAGVEPRDFILLLHHFPALAPRAAAHGVDLMLAGDTHGGQAKLPIVGELVRVHRRGYWRSHGLHEEGSLRLFVSRGIGNEGGVPRFRFNCRPEVARIDLVGTARPGGEDYGG